jgi:epoxyqueuosine reductase
VKLYPLLLQTAERHGFPLSGALDLQSAMESPDSAQPAPFTRHIERMDKWLANNFEGDMAYLRRGRDRRADPRAVFPKAQSIFCVAVPYGKQALGGPAEKGPRYARYLKSRDYHESIAVRLESLMSDVQSQWKETPLEWKICVDTSAVLERSWAALAGLGWIGKNTTLINPKYGSYLFLGEVLLSERVHQGPKLMPNYCGHCTKCLSTCPTQAFTEPGTLDSRRCISYWTLEKRGDLALSDSDRSKMGTWVAGCDVCQEVCPFNLKPARGELSEEKKETDEDDATLLSDWKSLLEESESQYVGRVRRSALSRVKAAQFSRNLAIVLQNVEPDAWTPGLVDAAKRKTEIETDVVAKAEWLRLMNRLS